MKKIIILAIGFLSLTACKKEKFIGYQSFWYDKSVAENLYYEGSSKLSLYVDGELINTVTIGTYYNSAPDCKEGIFVYEDKMYKNEVATHNYKIVDDFDDVIWEGTFTTKQSLCSAIELVD